MDYEALRALDAIIRQQNFERAAQQLFITQSAVSQRIAALETDLGEKVLVRELPYRPTELGEKLLAHLRQVTRLEEALKQTKSARASVRIALNLDSLELWFMHVLKSRALAARYNLEIFGDNENYTIEYMKTGRADLCITSQAKPLARHESLPLGDMTFTLVARPDFKKKHFAKGFTPEALAQAPAVIFNEKDDLHHHILKKSLDYDGAFPFTAVPSVLGHKTAIMAGYGYGALLIPEIKSELRAKKLIELLPHARVSRKLYLHYWKEQSRELEPLIASIREASQQFLRN